MGGVAQGVKHLRVREAVIPLDDIEAVAGGERTDHRGDVDASTGQTGFPEADRGVSIEIPGNTSTGSPTSGRWARRGPGRRSGAAYAPAEVYRATRETRARGGLREARGHRPRRAPACSAGASAPLPLPA